MGASHTASPTTATASPATNTRPAHYHPSAILCAVSTSAILNSAAHRTKAQVEDDDDQAENDDHPGVGTTHAPDGAGYPVHATEANSHRTKPNSRAVGWGVTGADDPQNAPMTTTTERLVPDAASARSGVLGAAPDPLSTIN